MAIAMTIHPERDLAYFRIWGAYSVAQGVDIFHAYVADPDFAPEYVLLSNARHMTELDADFRSVFRGVQSLRTVFKSFTKETKSVIYVEGDVAFGMGRLLQQVAEPVSGIRFEIYRHETEALAAARQSETRFEALDAALNLPPLS